MLTRSGTQARRLGLAMAIAAGALSASLPRAARAAEPEPDPEKPDYFRPALEIGAGLVIASLWYFVDDRNVLDWDRPSAEQRFNGDAWRFDNNTFALNYTWHPLAGAGMYVLARGNRLGVWPSFGYSLAGSTLWEFAIEFNEKVSINDVIVTPLAGMAIGEYFHKLGFVAQAHRALDGLGPDPARSELWQESRLIYGFGAAQGEGGSWRGNHSFGFESTFVSLPGYRRAKAFGRWFGDADLATLELELDANPDGLGIDLFGETLLAGHHQQALQGSRSRPTGHWLTAALGVAYSYRNRETFGFDDRLGLLHFPGLFVDAARAGSRWHASATARAYPTFGSMSAPVYRDWETAHPTARAKTVLQRESYFYGLGLRAMGAVRVGYRPLELRAELVYDRLSSVEGLDRTQERVTTDLHVSEAALGYAVSVWARSDALPLEFGAAVDASLRNSRAGGLERDVGGHRLLLKTALAL